MRRKSRYHRTDGWRGYSIPAGAVIGSSDTGNWDDSPAPTEKVLKEIGRFRREVLRPAGIVSRLKWSQSSNVFMVKRWLVVSATDFDRAAQLAVDWLAKHSRDTDYVHAADLEELGFTPSDADHTVAS